MRVLSSRSMRLSNRGLDNVPCSGIWMVVPRSDERYFLSVTHSSRIGTSAMIAKDSSKPTEPLVRISTSPEVMVRP